MPGPISLPDGEFTEDGLRAALQASLLLETLKLAERALIEGRARDALEVVRVGIASVEPKSPEAA